MASTPRNPASGKELRPQEDEDPLCRVKNVVPTSTVFAAALERLNRLSVSHLLQQVVQEVDQHCKTYGVQKTEEIGAVRTEMMALLGMLHRSMESQYKESMVLSQQLTELRKKLDLHLSEVETHVTVLTRKPPGIHLPTVISDITTSVSNKLEKTVDSSVERRVGSSRAEIDDTIKELRTQIEQLQDEKEKSEQGASELGPHELRQVEALILKLLASYDLSARLGSLSVTINNRVFALDRLLDVLATADKVVDTHIDYSDTDITGARMVLTDRTQVVFVCSRREPPGSRQVHYVFQTADWKGVAASFTLRFERRNTEMELCGRKVVLASYDGVFQSNIQFDLCPQIGTRAQ